MFRNRRKKHRKSFIKWKKDNWVPDDLCPPALEAQEALRFLQSYLLGDDWYVAMPLSTRQVNTVIVDEILNKFSKDYRTELKYAVNGRKKK